MSITDLGKRIAAARGYTGMSVQSLADAVGITVPTLERFESELQPLSETDEWALMEAVAGATRLPIPFFTANFEELPDDGPPEARLSRLEQKADETLSIINKALARMDHVVAEAEGQMTRGKEQLDRFIETMGPDRDLLRRIAAHLKVE